ncbi:nucleotide-diphospho-sugar transferase [Flagelloscypha sp. PMI_526]|nr:nucleotide-diphospho-sugar transferase [Flagelloscypha sp. PMI_526]
MALRIKGKVLLARKYQLFPQERKEVKLADGHFQVSSGGDEPYTIRELADDEKRDILCFPKWKRDVVRFIGLTGFVAVWMWARAACEQIRMVFKGWHDETSSPQNWVLAILSLLLYHSQWIPTVQYMGLEAVLLLGKWRKRLELVGNNVPQIDIVITCCNEPIDVIQDTVLGALALDYPRDAYRVIVSDDGASPAIASWVAMQKLHDNLYYTARQKPSVPDFKTGNLNHAIRFTKGLPGGPAPFFSSLDADMIPEKDWLRRVLPHLLIDAKVGQACPAQSYYNVPVNDPLHQENRIPCSIYDTTRDTCEAAWNSGSGYIVRREALDSVGGFPHSVSEDVYCAMLILAEGWKTVYVAECLQYGLVPDSYLGHIKQRAIGGLQLFFGFRGYLDAKSTKQMTFIQRCVGWTLGSYHVYSSRVFLMRLLLIPIFLATGWSAFQYTSNDELSAQIRAQALTWLSMAAYNAHRSVLFGYRSIVGQDGLDVYLSPYIVTTTTRAFLPRWFGGTEPRFIPTGSIDNNLNERSPSRRAPLPRRARHMLFGCGVWFHVLIVILFIWTIVFRFQAVLRSTQKEQLPFQLLCQIGLLFPSWLLNLLALLVPIKYTLTPPDVPDRDELMNERNFEGGPRYWRDVKRFDTSRTWTFVTVFSA